MKKIFILFGLIFLIQMQSFAQIDSRKVLYLKKIETYKRLRNTGFIMAGIGVASAAVGINMIAQEERKYNRTYQYDEDRVKTGIICTLAGIPLTIAGSIIGPIGAVKVGKYRKRLDNLSVNLNYSPHQRGLVFRYTF